MRVADPVEEVVAVIVAEAEERSLCYCEIINSI